MKSVMQFAIAGAVMAGLGLAANAAPTVDGVRDAAYGAAKAVQTVGTNFGNSTSGNQSSANGSELDAGYAIIDGANLHIFLSGNLETNFNKLDIFIDSVAGGQNQLRGDNVDVDFNGLNRMGNDGSGNGLKFDAGFTADYFLTTTGGNNPVEFFANFATLPTGGGGSGGFIGQSGPGNRVLNGNNGIVIGYDNSNTLGVNGLGNPNDSDPATVTTGIELLIPLALIGSPNGTINISAFINGGSHDFLANQNLGGLPAGTGNLGEPRSVDFSGIAGNQFFSVAVPEPTSLGLIGVGALAMLKRRRA
ncbi:hypothetical protein BH09PLA1_BH09PLA1_16890 [soil metagenome]